MIFDKIDAYLDERIGHRALFRSIVDRPIVGGARWAYALGVMLAWAFGVEAITGVLLMTAYAPSATTAWASVHYISTAIPGGWIVRGLHHYAAQAMIVLLGVHLLQVAVAGAYRRPREVTWWLGLALTGCVIGFGITGHSLPWDQAGYWSSRVETGIAATTPMVGKYAQAMILGGSEAGTMTLTRYYALHVAVLPAITTLLVVLHVVGFFRHGPTPRATADTKIVARLYPDQVARNAVAVVLLLAALYALTLRAHGAPLEAPADPQGDYPARPQWYFLPLFQLRSYFHGPFELVATMVIPGIAAAYFVLLPLLDKKPTTALRPRLGVLAPLFAVALGIAVLGGLAARVDGRDATYQAQRKRADERARIAMELARAGVPPTGALEMMRHDPDLRGEDLFAKGCASCHVLGDLGDPAKATAPRLTGWGTEAWIAAMLDDPDADVHFGKTSFKGDMPSMTKPPKDSPSKPMPEREVKAVAVFLAAQGDDAQGEKVARDAALVKEGEKIVTTRCTACHLWKGEGDEGGEETAPELSAYGSVAWVRAQIANPGTAATYRPKALDADRKGHMPRFDGELAPADVDLLARWVRARARGVPLAAAH